MAQSELDVALAADEQADLTAAGSYRRSGVGGAVPYASLQYGRTLPVDWT
jgi:hypothetical protein